MTFICIWQFIIRFWDANKRQQRAQFNCQTDCLRSIYFSPNSTTLADSRDNPIRLWDVKIG
ncbi:unnamed protein product [Paramecium octaurelia]|uniref:Uncharacterized protein n=1 Tax=Paramecium octaurelia TaxID=43137 RepID=A0A8S1XH43_PAROT|nr:unnamed protein product [Paramecium octaurelia]